MANLCFNFLRTLVGLPFVILITLLLTVLAVIFLPYRLMVQFIAQVFLSQLSYIDYEPQNAIYAAATGPLPPVNSIVGIVVDGKVNVETIRDRFRTRILTELAEDGTLVYQKLKQILVSFMGYRFFRPADHFCLEYHVRVFDPTIDILRTSNDRCFTEEDFKCIVGKLGSRPWKEGWSHWEMLIVENFRSCKEEEDKTLLMFRIDHAYGDAYSVDQILTKISDNPPKLEKRLITAPSTVPLWLRLPKTFLLPLQMIWDSSRMLTTVEFRKGPWVISRPDKVGIWNYDTTKQLPVSKIKGIKNDLNVSYNAVLLTALARALRRMCSDVGTDLPQVISSGFPLAKPHHPGSLTNHHYSAPLALPLPNATTIKALQAVDRAFKSIASSSSAPRMLDFCMALSRFIPSALTNILIFPNAPSISIAIFPSFTGPNYYLGNLASDQIGAVVPVAAPANNGAAVAIGGVNGRQRVSLLMHKSAFPQPEAFGFFRTYLEEEIEILEKLCHEVVTMDEQI